MDLRRESSNVTPAAKSVVKRLLRRVGKTDQARTDPKFEDARSPNVRELRCVQRRLSAHEVEALRADCEGRRACRGAGQGLRHPLHHGVSARGTGGQDPAVS